MDEYSWLAICFVGFLLLVGKKIYKALISFLQNKQNEIQGEFRKAELLQIEASNKLNDAKSIEKELESNIQYILKKTTEALEYDLKVRNENFDKQIKIKEMQIEHLCETMRNDFKKDMADLLVDNLHTKFILHFKENKQDLDNYTKKATNLAAH